MRVPFGLSGRTIVLSSGLVILLIVLGTLQYSWIDRVSRVERERRQNQLQDAAFRFTMDFDSELSRLHFFFQRGLMQSADAETWIGTGFHRWKNDQVYGDLLKEIWRVGLAAEEGGRGGAGAGPARQVVLQSFDPASSVFTRSDWPPYLAPIRARVEAARQGLPVPPERGFQPLDGTVPAILIPSAPLENRGRRLLNFRQLSLYVLVLDQEYIRDVLLPELASHHFARGPELEFRLWIRDRSTGAIHFEWPESNGQALPSRPDVRQPIFVLQSQREFSPGPGGGRGVGGAGRGRRARGPGPPPGVEPRGAGREGAWELLAVHRAGSLEAAVRQVKDRNLFLSTAILLILAAAIIVTLVSAQRARDLARLQMDFVASVSHELRTPLTAIRSSARNLEDGVVSEPVQIAEYGRIIGKAESRLSEMVMQVLDFARSQAPGPPEPVEPVHLARLVRKMIEDLGPSVLRDNAEVTVEIPEDLPPVSAGSNGLRRVFENLIQNSVKYSARPVQIRIEARTSGSQIEIAVRDNGPGINAQDLPYIFEPFFRGRNVQTVQAQGSGLGLSLVKRIVASFGGSVRVQSEPGRGAVFWISLKRAGGTQV